MKVNKERKKKNKQSQFPRINKALYVVELLRIVHQVHPREEHRLHLLVLVLRLLVHQYRDLLELRDLADLVDDPPRAVRAPVAGVERRAEDPQLGRDLGPELAQPRAQLQRRHDGDVLVLVAQPVELVLQRLHRLGRRAVVHPEPDGTRVPKAQRKVSLPSLGLLDAGISLVVEYVPRQDLTLTKYYNFIL